MPDKNPEKHRERQRKYARSEKGKLYIKTWNKSQSGKNSSRNSSQKNHEYRKGLLSSFTCCSCENRDPSVIQWHHLYPEDKSFNIFSRTGKPHDIWWNEVLKCVPLCANCHVKIHKNKLCLIPQTFLFE